MQKLVHTSFLGCEKLESRRLLASAAASLSPDTVALLLDVDVNVKRSATKASGWRETGALGMRTLPRGASVGAVAGRLFDFSRLAFERSLPASTKAAARVVLLPTPQGGFARFAVSETSLLAPHVAAAHPDIHTYRGTGIDDPSAVAQFDLTVNGLHATVVSPYGAWSVSPVTEYSPGVHAGGGQYASFFLAHDPLVPHELICGTEADHDHVAGAQDDSPALLATGPTRYTMRIAVAGNGEWTALAGGTQASGFATIVTAVNGADLIYQRDFNVAFTLVSTSSLVYTNAATDPYTNSNASTMLSENQTNLDAVITNANYDIGHVFTTSGGGVASLSVVGRPGFKARGVSGNSPQGSSFQPTFWHEMGHQFSSPHTWNHTNAEYSGQRSATSAYEPGPGSTIMSYGGFSFFPGNFVAQRDPYFHARSIELVNNHLENNQYGSTAGTRTPTGNSAPTLDAGTDRTIPARTPFEMLGFGSDTEALTYVWEQYDLGDEDPIGIDDGNGPLFRSRPPIASAARTFPELADVLANRSDADETLPIVSRTADPLTFRLTGRDALGGVNFDAVDLTVIDTGAAFAITSQNSPGTSWPKGSTQTVTWAVAGTTAAPINAALVTIYISYDGGNSFTPVLSGTSNDGSADIVVPAGAPNTSTARIKVKADNNIFFDICNANITIVVPVTPNGIWDAGGDGTNWNDAANWSNNVLPTATDDVLIQTAGTFTVNLSNAVTQVASLTLGNNSGSNPTLSLLTNGGRVLETGALTINGAAKLDLNDNDFILDYTGASQLPAIQTLINTGRAGGTWTGVGITSSAARDNPQQNTSLGAIEGADYIATSGLATFSGQPIDATAVLIKYTYYGDTDFNGKVDGADYARIDANFNQQPPDISGWINGDFNYDGKIDGADYALIDAAFNSQGPPLSVAGRTAQTPSAPRTTR